MESENVLYITMNNLNPTFVLYVLYHLVQAFFF